jgi:hypothetical protein
MVRERNTFTVLVANQKETHHQEEIKCNIKMVLEV